MFLLFFKGQYCILVCEIYHIGENLLQLCFIVKPWIDAGGEAYITLGTLAVLGYVCQDIFFQGSLYCP